MKAYHVNTGMRLDVDESKHFVQKYIAQILLFIIVYIVYVFVEYSGIWRAVALGVGAIILAAITLHAKQQYMKALNFYRTHIKDAKIRIDGRLATIDGADTPITLHGKHIVEGSEKNKHHYMVWKFKDWEPEDAYIFTDDYIYAPAQRIEDYYVIVIPPLAEYYLKIDKNITLESLPDKVVVYQDPGEQEYEFHYVAGTSRDARLEFEAHDQGKLIAKANGIPFQKLITKAGDNEEPIILVIDAPMLGKYKQNHLEYLDLLSKIGDRILLARGRLIVVLDYALNLDKRAETGAEFVRAE